MCIFVSSFIVVLSFYMELSSDACSSLSVPFCMRPDERGDVVDTEFGASLDCKFCKFDDRVAEEVDEADDEDDDFMGNGGGCATSDGRAPIDGRAPWAPRGRAGID